MRNIIIFAVILLLVPASPAHASPSCEMLESSIVVRFDDQYPLHISAGESVELTLTLKFQPTIKDWFAQSRMPLIPLQLIAANNVQGSKSMTEGIEIYAKDIDELKWEKKVKVRMASSQAMMGGYFPRLTVAYYNNEGGCYILLSQPQNHQILVNNVLERSDINPPAMEDLIFERSNYALGDELKIRVRLSDKTAICTLERSTKGKCQLPSHVEFEETATKREVNVFPSLLDLGNGWYEVSVQLSPKNGDAVLFFAGNFKIKIFDISDIWGNSIHEVPEILQRTFKIEETLGATNYKPR